MSQKFTFYQINRQTHTNKRRKKAFRLWHSKLIGFRDIVISLTRTNTSPHDGCWFCCVFTWATVVWFLMNTFYLFICIFVFAYDWMLFFMCHLKRVDLLLNMRPQCVNRSEWVCSINLLIGHKFIWKKNLTLSSAKVLKG